MRKFFIRELRSNLHRKLRCNLQRRVRYNDVLSAELGLLPRNTLPLPIGSLLMRQFGWPQPRPWTTFFFRIGDTQIAGSP